MAKNKTTNWRKEIDNALRCNKECWRDIYECTLTQEELNKEFDPGYGGEEGLPFTVWTKDYVYFPACYDGSEWVAWVHRNPDGHATSHVGGG
jgi:hypothetical protein